jgi:hypothetical protein
VAALILKGVHSKLAYSRSLFSTPHRLGSFPLFLPPFWYADMEFEPPGKPGANYEESSCDCQSLPSSKEARWGVTLVLVGPSGCAPGKGSKK